MGSTQYIETGHSTIIQTVFQSVCVWCVGTSSGMYVTHFHLTQQVACILLYDLGQSKIDEIVLEPGIYHYFSRQFIGPIENRVIEQHRKNSNFNTPLWPTRKSAK